MKELLNTYDGIVFFDTETTGLDPEKAQIIEFAAIKVTKDGITDELDEFIRLPEGEHIPAKIEELTHITDEMLEVFGLTEQEMAEKLARLIPKDEHILLAAHNAHFDLRFLKAFIRRNPGCVDLGQCDFLDTLTVYKDRAEYPHKLRDAIEHYELQEVVQNTHRAIDDVKALYYVALEMAAEEVLVAYKPLPYRPGTDVRRSIRESHNVPPLSAYVNLFGYNPKYGLGSDRIERVTYLPQPYSDFRNRITLPGKKR